MASETPGCSKCGKALAPGWPYCKTCGELLGGRDESQFRFAKALAIGALIGGLLAWQAGGYEIGKIGVISGAAGLTIYLWITSRKLS